MTSQVAELFYSMVIHLHGVPYSIISDCYPLFTSQFWQNVLELMGTKLRMSSAYHPQTNDQSEVLNQCLEQYLCAFTTHKPSSWATFLGWAKYHYNTSHHSVIGTSPFQAVYRRVPSSIPTYTRGNTSISIVEDILLTRDEILRKLCQHLLHSQQWMKHLVDKEQQEKQFQVEDLVLVKLKPYRYSGISFERKTLQVLLWPLSCYCQDRTSHIHTPITYQQLHPSNLLCIPTQIIQGCHTRNSFSLA